MANKDNMASLMSRLSRSKSGTRSTGGTATVTNLVVPLSTSNPSTASTLSRLADTKALGIGGAPIPTSIHFGTPSSTRTSVQASGNTWSKFLTQTASGGLGSALGNGFGSIGGLGSLVSSVLNLFGGGSKAAPPPLVRFRLPDSQSQTVYLGPQTTSVLQGIASEQSIKSDSQPIYTSTGAQASGSFASTAKISDASVIVQVVKQALLNSSSLNDVISEI